MRTVRWVMACVFALGALLVGMYAVELSRQARALDNLRARGPSWYEEDPEAGRRLVASVDGLKAGSPRTRHLREEARAAGITAGVLALMALLAASAPTLLKLASQKRTGRSLPQAPNEPRYKPLAGVARKRRPHHKPPHTRVPEPNP